MASYIQGLTDFVPDIQPFQPDWGTIDKTLRLRQGRYDQGYSNIQNTYSSLLNMPQLKQDQIDKRDKFMKQAFEKIGNLSTVDLSLPENVASAQGVFAPLYNDTEFLGNASISKHYQQQEALADSLRQKDGGKEFSMDNLNYVRQQKMDYINDSSPNSWQKYHAGKRYYEPYYDTKKEIREAMEKFKPSSSTIVRLNGMYKEKIEDNSWRQAEIKDYLDGVLSDKAKRQMQIEATVRLGSPDIIASMYSQTAKKDLSQLNSKIDDIDKAITAAKTPQERNQLIDVKNQLAESVQNIQENVGKIGAGDLSYIKANQEKLAYSMYYNSVIGDVSKGFAHQDIKQDITEDTVAFGMWKEAQAMKRFMIGEQNEMARFYEGQSREDRRLSAKLAAGVDDDGKKVKGPGDPLVYDIAATPGDEIYPTTLADLDAKTDIVKREGFNDSQKLKAHIAESKGVPLNKLTAKDVQSYMGSVRGKNDPEVQAFIDRSKTRHLTIEDSESTKKQAEDYAKRQLGPNFSLENSYNDFTKAVKARGVAIQPSYTLRDPQSGETVNLTPKQVFESIQKKNFDVNFVKGVSYRGYQAKYRGKTYNVVEKPSSVFDDSNKVGASLESFSALSKNKAVVNKDLTRFNNLVSQYFGEMKTDLRKGITFADDSNQIKATKQRLTSLTGIDNTRISEVGYSPNSDRNKVYFNAVGTKENPIDPEAVVQKLTDKGFKTTYNERLGVFEVINSKLDTQLDPFANLPGYDRALISTLETRTGQSGTKYQSTPFKFTNPTTKQTSGFRIDKRFGDDESSYYLYPEGSKTPVRSFETAFDAYQFSKQMVLNPILQQAILSQ